MYSIYKNILIRMYIFVVYFIGRHSVQLLAMRIASIFRSSSNPSLVCDVGEAARGGVPGGVRPGQEEDAADVGGGTFPGAADPSAVAVSDRHASGLPRFLPRGPRRREGRGGGAGDISVLVPSEGHAVDGRGGRGADRGVWIVLDGLRDVRRGQHRQDLWLLDRRCLLVVDRRRLLLDRAVSRLCSALGADVAACEDAAALGVEAPVGHGERKEEERHSAEGYADARVVE